VNDLHHEGGFFFFEHAQTVSRVQAERTHGVHGDFLRGGHEVERVTFEELADYNGIR
jgi:hypothetical protein